jgi:hypothetical protein
MDRSTSEIKVIRKAAEIPEGPARGEADGGGDRVARMELEPIEAAGPDGNGQPEVSPCLALPVPVPEGIQPE